MKLSLTQKKTQMYGSKPLETSLLPTAKEIETAN